MQARRAVSGYTNQNLADIATATVNVTTVDGATLVGSALTTADTITVVDAASVSAADADTFGGKLLAMQARWRSVVTQTKTSQTSPLPPSMSPLWMVQPLLVLLSPLPPTPSPLSMQPV